MFAVTNVDDIVIISLLFGRAAGVVGGDRRIVVGQYLGFAGILGVAVAGSLGTDLLPTSAVAYLGLVPLLPGVRARWRSWRERGEPIERGGGAVPQPARCERLRDFGLLPPQLGRAR